MQGDTMTDAERLIYVIPAVGLDAHAQPAFIEWRPSYGDHPARAVRAADYDRLLAAVRALEAERDQLKAEKDGDAWHQGWKVAVAERDAARRLVAELLKVLKDAERLMTDADLDDEPDDDEGRRALLAARAAIARAEGEGTP
jgi:hypothetical protein